MSNKFNDIVNKQKTQANKDLAVSTAKENLARANKEARDEVALAKEIDNAETLVTDENSVIDPANAGENAQFFSMNDMSVQPVSSVEINGVSVDPNKHQKTLKSFKLRNVTNWHRKLYFIAPAISVCAIAGALTPIAIVKPIKAMEPVITIDDDSSEGISVKSNNVRLNKDSTITLNCDDQDRIKTVNAYINDSELNQDQYSFDSMSNVVSIKAEAMTSVNVKLKVITDAPRFNISVSEVPAGLKNIKHKSYASFRKEFTFECELRDNYILEQNEFSNGLELTVNGRRLTEANEVSVKQLNGNKYTITIHKGIVNGDIKLSGRVTKFNCNFNKAQDTNEHNYVDKVHENETISYQHFDDIQNVVTLEDKGIRPKADITVDDNGREIKLVEGNDYTIASNWNSSLNKYEYDLNWTENGKKKIVGPVSMKLSASTATIVWDDNQVKDQNYTKVAVGMPARDMSFGAKTSEEGNPKIKDIKIINDNLGYKLSQVDNGQLKLIPTPGETQRTGTLTIQARLDELVDTVPVNVVEPSVTITGSQEVRVKDEVIDYNASISPSYLETEQGKIKIDEYKWTSDDDNIIKVENDGIVKVTGVTKGTTNLTATTTLTNTDTGIEYKCVGKFRINSVMPKFEEASWDYIIKAINKFEASQQTEKDMKELCNSFQDTPYIENISNNITDKNRQIEAHLAKFIGKEAKVKMIGDWEYPVRIIGINHDKLSVQPEGKSDVCALFTFETRKCLSNAEGYALGTCYDYDTSKQRYKWIDSGHGYETDPDASIGCWFCTDNHKSILYSSLNSTDSTGVEWYNFWKLYCEHGKNYDWIKNNTDSHIKDSSLTKSAYTLLSEYFTNTLGLNNPLKQVEKYVGINKDKKIGPSGDASLFSINKYNAYCFPMTTAELNGDQSKVTADVPCSAVKNEGFEYKYFVDNPSLENRVNLGDFKDASESNPYGTGRKHVFTASSKLKPGTARKPTPGGDWNMSRFVYRITPGEGNEFIGELWQGEAAQSEWYGVVFCFCI